MREYLLLEMLGYRIIGVAKLPERFVYAPLKQYLFVDSDLPMSEVFAIADEVLTCAVNTVVTVSPR